MTVYVDDMARKFGRMVMCHMLADTDDELHAMADKIGVARKWHQNTVSGSHYDIAGTKRVLAVAAGAVEITLRQAAVMTRERRETGKLGSAEAAAVFLKAHEAAMVRAREAQGNG